MPSINTAKVKRNGVWCHVEMIHQMTAKGRQQHESPGWKAAHTVNVKSGGVWVLVLN